MRSKRFAIIVAEAVNVTCPHCGEPQPNPDDGSEQWSYSQVMASRAKRNCTSCDEPFEITMQNKVTFQ